jgi:acyl-CoA synthetase (NDP forming)
LGEASPAPARVFAPLRAGAPHERILDVVRAEGRTSLLESEALDLLDAHGIATPPRILVRSEAEARSPQ